MAKRIFYKPDSEIEKRLQQVEELMSDLGITVSYEGGLVVSYTPDGWYDQDDPGQPGTTLDNPRYQGVIRGDSGISTSLPRITDDERILAYED
jgi:hypothetical protein